MKGVDMRWTDYLHIQGASNEQIADEEAKVGHPFPGALKNLLKERQGWAPSPFNLTLSTGMEPAFLCLAPCAGPIDAKDYTIRKETRHARDDNDELDHLVAFAHSGGNARYCLDYSAANEPAVVYADADYEVDDPRAFILIAPTFEDFLAIIELGQK